MVRFLGGRSGIKNNATYFSILSAVSGGINTQPEIESALGDKSIGGQIKRLIEDYNIIVRQRPIMAKEGSQAVRYEIQDNFIRFWFNYFDRHRSLIESSNLPKVFSIVPLVHGGSQKEIRMKLILLP